MFRWRLAGVDEGQPQVAAVETEGEVRAAPAVGVDDKDRGRMSILIVLGILGVVQSSLGRCT